MKLSDDEILTRLKKKRKVHKHTVLFQLRLAFSFAILGSTIIAIGSGSFSQLTSSWSCMGAYSAASLSLWLPLLLLNFVCTLAATAYSYEAIFVQRNISQYAERREINMEGMDYAQRNNVLKVTSFQAINL
ncbi:hypothetical protein ANCCAN_13660 [Ancylostoma caninum]|uniref:Uncharacterized protein n=1 Tax=Ancylostoma caninum TaxID=29170 RepID=A0A368G7J5_ANCCA|nr:hypothetical protein ANCCAN_13660 [Ancylostoma caninum]